MLMSLRYTKSVNILLLIIIIVRVSHNTPNLFKYDYLTTFVPNRMFLFHQSLIIDINCKHIFLIVVVKSLPCVYVPTDYEKSLFIKLLLKVPLTKRISKFFTHH